MPMTTHMDAVDGNPQSKNIGTNSKQFKAKWALESYPTFQNGYAKHEFSFWASFLGSDPSNDAM